MKSKGLYKRPALFHGAGSLLLLSSWPEWGDRLKRPSVLFVFALILGIVLGVLLHDRIIGFNPGRAVWKSYPPGLLRGR